MDILTLLIGCYFIVGLLYSIYVMFVDEPEGLNHEIIVDAVVFGIITAVWPYMIYVRHKNS